MTVRELIAELEKFDRDKEIRIDSYPGWEEDVMIGIQAYESDGVIWMSELLGD